MSERSIASTIYPDLPSGAPTPAPEPAPEAKAGGSEKTAAQAIYGGDGPSEGIEKTKETIAAGVARPASEVAAAERGEVVGEYGLAPGQLADRFAGLAKEVGLSRENASKMVALHREALNDASVQYWEKTGQDWAKQSRAQFGSRLNGMVRDVQPLLNDPNLTPPAFLNLLNTYKIGSHPVVIDMLNRWARAIGRR